MSWNIQSPFSDKNKRGANPFFMYANESMPIDQQSSLDFCVHLTNLNSGYAAATKRVVSHFITDVEFEGEGGDYKERSTRKKLLVEKLDVFQSLQTMGEDGFCYGISVVRMHLPFDRYLIKRGTDPNGNKLTKRISINSIPEDYLKYDWKHLKFNAPDIDKLQQFNGNWDKCPKIDYDFEDVFVRREDEIKLIHLDPRFFKLRKAPQSGKIDVIYKFDPEELQYIRSNNVFYVNNTHKSMLQAIAKDMAFIFDKSAVFIYAPPTITGISKNGLGIPAPIAHYRDLFQWQLYRKADETLAKDYLVPLRLFSPGINGTSGGMDAGATVNIAMWKKNMGDMIKKFRDNKDSMFAVPMATSYQEVNGNGKNFTPKDLLAWQTDALLNGLGYPAELFRGTLAYQQIPPALRLFERAYHHIPHNFNKFLKWVNKRVAAFLRINEFDVHLAPPRIADSVERMNYVMQLVSGGEAPREAIYELLSLGSPVDSYKRRLKEDSQFEKSRSVEEMQFQKEKETTLAELQTQGSGGEQGGAGPVTPLSRQEEAMQKAKDWAAMPEATRKQDMENTRNTNVELHALAMQYLKQIRTDAEGQGRNQAVNPQ
jgi:hypothetical protein